MPLKSDFLSIAIMNNVLSQAMGCVVVSVAAVSFSAERLEHTSDWETLSYEAQQFPQDAPSPWN